MNNQDSASIKESHDFLVGLLERYQNGFIDFAFKNGAILTLILGWLIASDTAQTFFGSSDRVRLTSMLFMTVYGLAYVYWVVRWFRKSDRAFHQLCEISYMPTSYFESLKIQTSQAVIFIFVHLVGTVAVNVFLYLS